MALDQAIVGIVAAIIQLVVGLALAMGSVYIGLKLFDRMTKGIDEWKEILKGNVAVGILMAAVIFSIANVVQSGVGSLLSNLGASQPMDQMLIDLVLGLVNLLIGLAAAIFSIWVALKVLDRITKDVDEMKELAKGNVAVAVIMAGVLLAVSFVIAAAVSGISNALALI
ncbi:MAG: DUF350 domain-containing protein [Candidatus Saccharibacteria bacterium]